jgi:hypothetical protein
MVAVHPSTYFLLKMIFFALGQKDATSLCRKSEPEICPGL